MPKAKLTCTQMYTQLRKDYTEFYKGHFVDTYEGQNLAERAATSYAVKNIAKEWRRQYVT